MKVEKIQKRGSKYKIILNDGNEITTSGEVILKNNLLYNKEIDEKLLEKINNDTVYYQAYNKTRPVCEVRPRKQRQFPYLREASPQIARSLRLRRNNS